MNKILEDRSNSAPPIDELEAAQVDSVYRDGAADRVIEAAEQLREGGLASAVLADDCQRGASRAR